MNGQSKAAAAGSAGAALIVLADDAGVGLVTLAAGGDEHMSDFGDLWAVLQADIYSNRVVLGLGVAGVAVALCRATWRRFRGLIDIDRDGRSDLDGTAPKPGSRDG